MTMNVKQLLWNHDYITIVQKSGDGCIVTYPHPKMLSDLPRLISSFVFQRKNEFGIFISTSLDPEDQLEKFIPVPEYAMRLYVLTEILYSNTTIPIDTNMVVYLDEEKEEYEGIGGIVSAPSDVEKEDQLIKLIIKAREEGFPAEYKDQAESLGIDEGFNIIRGFYE